MMGQAQGNVADEANLSTEALKQAWHDHYGLAPPKRISRDLLMRAAAYQRQVQLYGGLKPATQRRLARLAAQLRETGRMTVGNTPSLAVGTRLIRAWHGTTHEVWVLEDGFLWQGTRYGSLSEIARCITGTRWSGPAFFGLKGKAIAA